MNQIIDGGATEADGGASAPVGPSVATPLVWGLEVDIFEVYFVTSCVQLYHILMGESYSTMYCECIILA